MKFKSKSETVAAIRAAPVIQRVSPDLGPTVGTLSESALATHVSRLTATVERLQRDLADARALARQAHEDVRTVAKNAEANFAALEQQMRQSVSPARGYAESFTPRRNTEPGGGFFRPQERRVDPRLVEVDGIVDAETLDLDPQEIDVTPGGW